MIGQQELLNIFDLMISTDKLPHFIILVGTVGSGRKTLVREIIVPKFENKVVWLSDIDTNGMRQVSHDAYEKHNTLFVIPDADSMRNSAKNALLKVVEECPNNNYFVLTLENLENTLDTIKSRGAVFRMLPYSSAELISYAPSRHDDVMGWGERDAVRYVCETPGDVDTLFKYDIQKFMDYVTLVYENIEKVSGANVFKKKKKIALQDGSDGYDMKLFLRAFMHKCMDGMRSGDRLTALKCSRGIRCTSRCLNDLYITGIHKQSAFDMWILDIRQEWMES